MKTRTKMLAGAVGIALVTLMFTNYLLTAPGGMPTSTAGCVKEPDGTFISNGRVCDRVDYVLFKQGLSFLSPYSLHLMATGWTFINSSRGGSFFTFETHNLLTNNGVTYLIDQVHCNAAVAFASTCATGTTFTQFTVNYLAISPSVTAPNAADTVCGTDLATGMEITEFTLDRTLGTYSLGSVSGGAQTLTLSATWTASGAYPAGIVLGCAWTGTGPAADTGTTSYPQIGTLYAENTFSAVNLNSGDQLTITWTFTYSG